jgi:pyruvate,water dikinase
MNSTDRPVDGLLASLQERAKELNCLYEVEQILARFDIPLDDAFQKVVEAIPPGWQYPDICCAVIEIDGRRFQTREFSPTTWVHSAEILVQDDVVGSLSVWYLEKRPPEDNGPFLKEEDRLINTIAERLGHSILFHRMHEMRGEWENASRELKAEKEDRWRVPIDLLLRTDRHLYLRIARRMVNHLVSTGIDGAQELLQDIYGFNPDESELDPNLPGRSRALNQESLLSGAPFELAIVHLGAEKVLALTRDWILEDKASFLPKVLNNPRLPLSEVSAAVHRFHHLLDDGAALSQPTLDGIRVSLIRRFLSDQLDFISVAKRHLDTEDFLELIDSVILSESSHGRVGGKSAGLFLARRIIERQAAGDPSFPSVRVPRSWYLASEGLVAFIEHNDLDEVLQQKYREIAQVRQEYPNIIHLFKNSRFPPDVVKAASVLMDEVGDSPLIVRSSSLLEDRLGSAFSGKYKSLFLANQGDKNHRMHAFLDAIAEIYASVFGPDPIAYRRERGLIDFHEEMAILVQEVVGARAGRYFLPAVAGVAFSSNEFRWSSRIQRSDGLLRLVPGLGTRAVDRISDDYPILVVPGQPGLRVNTTIDEVIRYSPRKIDVINLEENRLECLDIAQLLAEVGADYPAFELVFSLVKDDTLRKPVALMVDPARDELVADFGGLVSSTPFVARVNRMLKLLESSLGTPVDLEFAFDGNDFYLLQCRPQSFGADDAPAPIPKDIPDDDTLFRAGRYVSNGWLPDITHIVYVDPESYGRLRDRAELLAVGKAVGQLNKMLPKRQFILMGPGRWGSRGDIKLGVNVSYSDINNTAMLVEIARTIGNYVPDLSFGTHFFQDLVESSIRYLPLYPDEDSFLNQTLLHRSVNLFAAMLPEYEHLSDVVRVIDLTQSNDGRILRVLMNSELDEAIAYLAEPDEEKSREPRRPTGKQHTRNDSFWQWRMRMAERIAAEIDPQRFGVKALYLIGSTKNATAGPSSDIDLVIHVDATDARLAELETWLEGWSLCLGELNYQRTGYATGPLLDTHIVTDEDVENRTSYAAKIGAVTDPALELTIGGGGSNAG